MLTLLFFTIKGNFFDKPNVPQTSETSYSVETESGTDSETTDYEPPKFRVNLIDCGVLLAVITAYSVHKVREKRKQRRL